MFSLPEAEEGFIPGAYVSEGSWALIQLGGWPCEEAAEMVRTYEPETEVIFMIIGLDFAVDCYLIDYEPSPVKAFRSSHLAKQIRVPGDPKFN